MSVVQRLFSALFRYSKQRQTFWNTIFHIFLYLQTNADFFSYSFFREFLPMKTFTDLALPFVKSLATSGQNGLLPRHQTKLAQLTNTTLLNNLPLVNRLKPQVVWPFLVYFLVHRRFTKFLLCVCWSCNVLCFRQCDEEEKLKNASSFAG